MFNWPEHVLRSLSYPNFRLYFLGHTVTVFGVWMQNVAQAWLVYRLTESSFALGLASFCALSPMLFFGLLGGGLADRFSPYRLLLASQSLAMCQAFALAALALSGRIQVWHILVLAFCLGLTQAIQIPARHAFIARLVPRDSLPNAVALNSTAFNSARFAGPALAGALVALTNEGIVFLINGFSFLAYLYAMLLIEPPAPRGARERPRLLDGLAHAWRDPLIRGGLLMVGLVSLVGGTYVVLMPVFARMVFGGGPEMLGSLMGLAGGGSLVGALALAGRTSPAGLDRTIGAAGVTAGIALFLFSRTDQVFLASLTLPVIGFSLTTMVVATNTLIQLQVSDEFRGRVMSLFSVTFLGLTPVGNFIAGSVSELSGAPTTVMSYAIVFSVCAVLFLEVVRRRRSVLDGRSK